MSVPSSTINLGGTIGSPLIARSDLHDDAEFDITAMIDLVFMMNIYFLVTFLTAALGEIDLPSASHVAPLDAETAVVLTVMAGLNDDSVSVHLAAGPDDTPMTEPEAQERATREAVEEGVASGKTDVLIKAEKNVCLRDLFRIMSAAAVEGVKIHVAVMEVDKPK